MSDLTANPIIVTTAAVIFTGPVEVERMEYVPSVTTNVITLEDKDGRVIWNRTAIFDANGNGVQIWDQPYTFNGLEVAVITAGTLYIYLKQPR